HFKNGGYPFPPNHQKSDNRGCCGGVVTQVYGQPDNPVHFLEQWRKPQPYLPPRHFADCHNRKRTIELHLTTTYTERLTSPSAFVLCACF
ncbi:hypothetical protein ACSC8C_005125, partial [Escherichia coli]